LQHEGVVFELLLIRLSIKESEAEDMIALICDETSRVHWGLRIMMGHQRTAEEGEPDLLFISIKRKDIGGHHSHTALAAGRLSPITQRKLPTVITADQRSSHNAVCPLFGR